MIRSLVNVMRLQKKQKQQNNIYQWYARPVPPEINVTNNLLV